MQDYTKFAEQPVEEKKPEVVVVDTPAPVEEAVKVEVEVPVKEEVKTEVTPAKINIPARKSKGVVADCTKLNVRAEAKSDAEVICTITRDTELEIDERASTRDFYKVCTAAGVEGYCMKRFITIMP